MKFLSFFFDWYKDYKRKKYWENYKASVKPLLPEIKDGERYVNCKCGAKIKPSYYDDCPVCVRSDA